MQADESKIWYEEAENSHEIPRQLPGKGGRGILQAGESKIRYEEAGNSYVRIMV